MLCYIPLMHTLLADAISKHVLAKAVPHSAVHRNTWKLHNQLGLLDEPLGRASDNEYCLVMCNTSHSRVRLEQLQPVAPALH